MHLADNANVFFHIPSAQITAWHLLERAKSMGSSCTRDNANIEKKSILKKVHPIGEDSRIVEERRDEKKYLDRMRSLC